MVYAGDSLANPVTRHSIRRHGLGALRPVEQLGPDDIWRYAQADQPALDASRIDAAAYETESSNRTVGDRWLRTKKRQRFHPGGVQRRRDHDQAGAAPQ